MLHDLAHAHLFRLACLTLLDMSSVPPRTEALTRLRAETRDLTFRPALWELAHLTRDHARTLTFPVTDHLYPVRVVAHACRTLGPVEFKLWFDLVLMGQWESVGVSDDHLEN